MRLLCCIVAVVAFTTCGCPSDSKSSNKDKSGKDKSPPPPCHPGCFPAGTMITTPSGLKAIESIREGDIVTLVDTTGATSEVAVRSTFQTCNDLLEVVTDTGKLLTTTTQPLCLTDGEFRRAGELVEGDTIWRWNGEERCPARVQVVKPSEREVRVFNLVVGESAVFVANGFLARGKPPQ